MQIRETMFLFGIQTTIAEEVSRSSTSIDWVNILSEEQKKEEQENESKQHAKRGADFAFTPLIVE